MRIFKIRDKTINQVDEFIKTQQNSNPMYKGNRTENWREKFFLDSVCELSPEDKLQFEVCFEPVNDDDRGNCSIAFMWDNGRLTEINVK